MNSSLNAAAVDLTSFSIYMAVKHSILLLQQETLVSFEQLVVLLLLLE